MLFLALGDTKVPDARYFAFWWNIGLTYPPATLYLGKLCCLIYRNDRDGMLLAKFRNQQLGFKNLNLKKSRQS